jgi:LacI family transcriptional regulator
VKKVPTIREIAAQAGVSRTTVSLALRNSPLISDETKATVVRIAGEQGYKSDPLVASLMARLRVSRVQRGAEKIAFLTLWPNQKQRAEGVANDYSYSLFDEGIRSRAEQLGYEVEEFSARELGITYSRLSRILYTRGIRGVIVAPLWRPHGHITLDWQHFSTATLTYTVTKPEMHRVTHSHFGGMQMALRHAKRLGYQRPGFATALDQNERVWRLWEGSYLANRFSSRGIIPPLLPKAITAENLRKWMTRYEPDVVISNQLTLLELLVDQGYSVPRDVGYISLDLGAGSFREFKSLAGIDQMPRLQGETTAEIVIKQMQNNQFGLPRDPQTIQLSGAWRDGDTVRMVKRPSA